MTKTEITREDIMPMSDYEPIRKERRAQITEMKRNRRLGVGPFATFYFESYDTMWHQIHEMLFIEKGGDAQIEDELRAYNPLIPKGSELVATVMLEIEDADRRHRELMKLGGIEDTFYMTVNGERIEGESERDVDRTTAAGKASSVQFVHFPFTAEQVDAFRKPGAEVVVGIDHENYGHMAKVPEAMREALAGDFA